LCIETPEQPTKQANNPRAILRPLAETEAIAVV
jgi:hypothetical protein